MLNEWTPQMCKTNLLTAGVCKVEFDKCILALGGIHSTAKATRLNHRYEPLDFLPSRIIPWEFNRNVNKRPCVARNKTSWIRPLMGSILDWDSSSIQVSKVGNTDDLVGNERKWVGYLLQGRLKTGELVDVRPVGKSCGQVENVVSARQQPQICESLVRFVHVISLFNCACCTNADHLLNSPPC